jgi:hypothetical protein
MRKVLLTAAAVLGFSAAAYADTVAITSVTDMTSPAQPGAISSTNTYAFVGTRMITFTVAGKTCNFVGSASGSVPLGCNYQLTVNNSTGALSNPKSLDNPVCTPTAQMLANCK